MSKRCLFKHCFNSKNSTPEPSSERKDEDDEDDDDEIEEDEKSMFTGPLTTSTTTITGMLGNFSFSERKGWK